MTSPRDDMPPDRNLALELVRVTEAAALQAARLVGMGDKEAADQAAVDGMHAVLHTIHMDGVVVIGEGEKDEAPMLANGEVVGDGSPPHVDIAVDPLEGTRLAAEGRPNALAVIALSERGTMFDPGPVFYMEKMAGRDEIADLLDLDRPLGKTVELVAERRGVEVRDVMVVVLDRPRHEEGIKAIREAGARVRLITDGDVAGALLAAAPDRPVDLLWGIGGTPEGVITAAALKCYGGGLIGRLWPRDDEERRSAPRTPATTSSKVMTHDDLVKGENCFFCATGVTDGDVLRGVHYEGARGATTESLVMRSRSGTVRRIASRHDRTKLRELTGYRLRMKAARRASSRSGSAGSRRASSGGSRGRPPIVIDGQRLEADVQLMLALREWLGEPVWDERPERRARAGADARGGRPSRAGRAPCRSAASRTCGSRACRRACYTSAEPGDKPLLLYLHGGGFVVGDLDTHDAPCRVLCRHAGVDVLSRRVPQGARAPVPGLRRGRAHRVPLGRGALRARRRRRRQRGRQPRRDARDRVRPGARAADLPGRRRDPGAPLARAVRQGLLPHRRADGVVHGPLPARGRGPRRPAALAAALAAARRVRAGAGRHRRLRPAARRGRGLRARRCARPACRCSLRRFPGLFHGFINSIGASPSSHDALVEVAGMTRALLRSA